MANAPVIRTEYSATYKRINVAGIFGGIVPGGLEAIVYSQERRAEQVLENANLTPDKMTFKRTVETELIIDPLQMKAVYEWLGEKIKEYENIFGPVPSSEEIESKFKKRRQR